MKKVLIINTVYEGGGAAKVARELFFYLNSQNGYEAYFAYGRGAKDKKDKTIKFGNVLETFLHLFLVRWLGLEGYGSYFSTKKLINLIKKENFNLVHLHNLHGYYLNFFKLINFLKETEIPIIWTLHDEWLLTWLPAFSMGCDHCHTLKEKCSNKYDYPKNYLPIFSRYLLKKKRETFSKNWDPLIICPAQWLLNNLKKSPFKNLRSELISNGADTNLFKSAANKGELRKKYQLPTDQKIILFLAYAWWDKNKGVNYVLEAANLLKEKNYLFLGLGTNKIPAANNLKFIDYSANQNNVAEIFSLADAFCFPSAIETSPLAVYEALASGLPVVAFDILALKEIINGTAGILIDYGGSKKLAEGLDSALSNEENLKKMSRAAHFMGEKFSIEYTLNAYLKYYQELIK